ncbi:MAG: Glucosaminyl phosphatidylinositol (GlcN-PI) nositol acylation protein [Cirrosporium novae-zelandiae]|nr:MAG: Glucosaminyl phosphatidylinositol (GlcN-PI) nositol acylation protein [Cirrosporium novae-zelandiae]
MATSYKTLKEDFVSNLAGGDISEINWVTAVAPAAVLLWSALQSRQTFFTPYHLPAIVTDFLLNICAILCATTIYSSQLILLNLLISAPALLLYTIPPSRPKSEKAKPPSNKRLNASTKLEGIDSFPVRPFITTYRGAMMIVTCTSILAVDFHVFPRRFAKVETWGTSLMDLGVGSFVFSSGVVSAKAAVKDQMSPKPPTLFQRLAAAIRHSIPLLILGVARLYSVKNLEYAEHVTEYGVHWNFFFTLGFLPPFVALFQSVFSVIPSYAVLSFLIALIYQVTLESTPLQAYVLTAPRTNLISQNREGMASFIGYLAIFLAGRGTGSFLMPRFPLPSNQLPPTRMRHLLLQKLAIYTAAYILLFLIVTSFKFGSTPISRRLANLPYILWVSAFNNGQILVLALIETMYFPSVYQAADLATEKRESERATSRILKAYNRNGLVIFLAANLGTGLINLSVNTLNVGIKGAMGVLMGYVFALTGLALGLDAYDISIKL